MQEPCPHNEPHWGWLGTLIWAVLIGTAVVVVSTAAIDAYGGFSRAGSVLDVLPPTPVNIEYDGLLIALSTVTTTLVCVTLLALAVKLKRGATFAGYFGLGLPVRKQTIKWVMLFIGFLVLLDILTLLLGRPIIPEFMQRVYASMDSRWLLWFALIVAAPLTEELFFRGFLLKGIAASAVGPVGAVIITSSIWSVIHLQYDLFGIGLIFAMGLFLGMARVKTGSTLLTVVLHALANLIATLQTAIYLRYISSAA